MRHLRRLCALGVTFLLALTACSSDSSGPSQAEFDDLQAQLEAAQDQLAATEAVVVVQAGELSTPPAGEAPSGWETSEAIRGGMSLFAQYDSSGPDAWDVTEHPMVYFSSEGVGNNPLSADETMLPGFYVIDAYTKEVVTGGLYSIGEMTNTSHGVTVSPDGKWVYFGARVTVDDQPQLVLMIVNARTMKLDKVLAYPGDSFVHHMMAFTDVEGNDRVVITVNRCPQFFLDPNDDNRVVRTITTADVPLCGHTYPTIDRTGQFFYQSMDGSYYGGDHVPAGVSVIDLLSDERGRGGYQGQFVWGFGEGGRPIGMAHTADGKYTYVVDAHNSYIFKLNNETMEIEDYTSAGVAGPYGACLNWDESRLYVVGKGEGTHNRGAVLGVIDTIAFRGARDLHQMPIWLGGSASSVDHCILHPDPTVNELWISNMNGWETIILDLDTNEVEAYVPTPNGGDTHSGAFVSYEADWTGTLLYDIGGPHTEDIWQMREDAVAARLAGTE
jgi:hypothetical protein